MQQDLALVTSGRPICLFVAEVIFMIVAVFG